MRYTYTKENYLARKINEVLAHAATWMKLEHILYNSIYIKCPEQANQQREKVHSWLPKPGGHGVWDRENGREVGKGYTTSFGANENVLKSAVVVVAQFYD